jgi:hypothetical protein
VIAELIEDASYFRFRNSIRSANVINDVIKTLKGYPAVLVEVSSTNDLFLASRWKLFRIAVRIQKKLSLLLK